MLNVIIVDDDVNVRNGIRRVIDWEGIGACVQSVEKNGLDAFNAVCILKPDLVISDIKMPVMDICRSHCRRTL